MRALLALLLCARVAAATTYHVATTGNDTTGDGSIGAPWLTGQKAANTAVAGDTVLFASGTYTGRINFPTSGATGNAITFQNESGATPILDGTGIANTNIPLLQMKNVHHLVLSGFTIQRSITGVFSEDGVCVFITGTAHHITLQNSEVRNCGTSGVWVETSGTTPNWLRFLTLNVHDNANGGLTIWLSPGGYILIDGGSYHDNLGAGNYDGIQVGGGSGAPHHVVIRNVSAYGNGGTSADQVDLGGHAFGDYFLFEDSDVHGPGGSVKCQQGFGGKTIICRRLRLTNVGFQNYEFPSPSTLYNNTVVNSGHDWQFYNQTPTALPGSSFGGLEAFNNAFIRSTDYLIIDNQVPVTANIDLRYSSLRFRCNAYQGSARGIYWGPYVSGNATVYHVEVSGTGAAAFAAFQNYTDSHADHQEVGGLWIDPTVALTSLFANPGTNDYHLVTGSPLIDAGCPLTTTTSSGSGTVVPVARASVVVDGWCDPGNPSECLNTPDQVKIGSQSTVAVVSEDPVAGTITIASSRTWSTGDWVTLGYSGNKPDIGAFESATTASTTTTVPTTSTSTSSSTVTTSTSSTVTTLPPSGDTLHQPAKHCMWCKILRGVLGRVRP